MSSASKRSRRRERTWPYELRFYDPPPNGFTLTLRLRGSAGLQLYVGDYTVGLEQLPGFAPRPPALDRSPYHTSDIVVIGRTRASEAQCAPRSRQTAVRREGTSGPPPEH
jgi:hypothetical protein